MGTLIEISHDMPSGNHKNLYAEWVIVTPICPFSHNLIVSDGTLGVSDGTLEVSDGTLEMQVYASEQNYP